LIAVDGTISRRIFPVRLNTKGIPFGPPFDTDGSPMWRPFQERDPLPEEIAAWNRITSPHNWGLVLGRASGFTVLDIDPRNGADPAAFAVKYEIPRTFTVKTPSGGLHWYFWHSAGLRSQLMFDRNPGVELKSNGTLAPIPPSGRDGRKYEIVDESEAAGLPPKIFERAGALRAGGNTSTSGRWKMALDVVPIGEQDTHLISLAGVLARQLTPDLWPTIPKTLAARAANWPHDPRRGPWTAADFERITESACRMESARQERERAGQLTIRVLE